MKKLITLLFFSISAIFLIAQDVEKIEWKFDYEAAKQEAANTQKDILLVFSGSDWCAPCIKLEKEIWESRSFIDHASENYIMLKADFPRKKSNRVSKEQESINNFLAERYNRQGYFPLVLILNAEGEVLGKTGYKGLSPSEYIELLTSLKN